MKELKTIIKNELRNDENIFINTNTKINDLRNDNWYMFEEYTLEQVFMVYPKETKVKKYWHEEGLCIILNI